LTKKEKTEKKNQSPLLLHCLLLLSITTIIIRLATRRIMLLAPRRRAALPSSHQRRLFIATLLPASSTTTILTSRFFLLWQPSARALSRRIISCLKTKNYFLFILRLNNNSSISIIFSKKGLATGRGLLRDYWSGGGADALWRSLLALGGALWRAYTALSGALWRSSAEHPPCFRRGGLLGKDPTSPNRNVFE